MHSDSIPDPEKKLRWKCAIACTCVQGSVAVVSDLPIKRLTRATREGLSKLAASKETLPTASKTLHRLQAANAPIGKHYPRKAQTASYLEPGYGPSDRSGSRIEY